MPTGKPQGERGARKCCTCLLWLRFEIQLGMNRDYGGPDLDVYGRCDFVDGWNIRTEYHWCDAWIPDMSKV